MYIISASLETPYSRIDSRLTRRLLHFLSFVTSSRYLFSNHSEEYSLGHGNYAHWDGVERIANGEIILSVRPHSSVAHVPSMWLLRRYKQSTQTQDWEGCGVPRMLNSDGQHVSNGFWRDKMPTQWDRLSQVDALRAMFLEPAR